MVYQEQKLIVTLGLADECVGLCVGDVLYSIGSHQFEKKEREIGSKNIQTKVSAICQSFGLDVALQHMPDSSCRSFDCITVATKKLRCKIRRFLWESIFPSIRLGFDIQNYSKIIHITICNASIFRKYTTQTHSNNVSSFNCIASIKSRITLHTMPCKIQSLAQTHTHTHVQIARVI